MQWYKETLSILIENESKSIKMHYILIKIDEEELSALTKGITAIEGMKLLKKQFSLEFVI